MKLDEGVMAPSLWGFIPGNDVRAVIGRSTEEGIGDFTPARVAREGDKQIRLAKLSNPGHRILVQSLHVPWPSNEGRRQDHVCRSTNLCPNLKACKKAGPNRNVKVQGMGLQVGAG